jgi:uncharacterized protein
MAVRKDRVRVVVDTNVFVRNFKARSNANPNRRIIRLWLIERRLQLIASPELMGEYLEIFAEIIGLEPRLIAEWRERFEEDNRTTLINLGRHYTQSRDPDDNILLATARAGDASHLITNDRDLLELPTDFVARLPFAVLTPLQFLSVLE